MCISGLNNFEPTIKSIQRNVYKHDFINLSDNDAKSMLNGKESMESYITYKLSSSPSF